MAHPPADSPLPQKLVAILHADVAGYSRLSHADELGTHQALRASLDTATSLIARYYGRVANHAGDAVLAEFDKVSNALTCAAAIQQELTARNIDLPADRQIQLRIGINLGEVIVDDGDLFGDGVNIAARLTTLADPGGVVVSEAIHDVIGTKLPLHFDYLGEQQVKNIAWPVRAYRMRVEDGTALPSPQPSETRALRRTWLGRRALLVFGVLAAIAVGLLVWFKPWALVASFTSSPATEANPQSRPSIAVLPFKNLSGDPKQEYFSDGISEDIITDLSRLSSVKVLASQTAFTYKGRSVDVQQIGKELGVQYVLEGGIQKTADHVRISVKLVNVHDGFHMWAERYDRKLADVFKLQDEITSSIISALLVKLTGDERALLAQKSTQNFEAYNLFLKGQELYRTSSREGMLAANDAYRQALVLDPGFSRAYGAYAINLIRQQQAGLAENPDATLKQALEYARKSVELGPMLAQTNWALGYTYMGLRRYDDALKVTEELVRRYPNYADGLGLLAFIKNRIGRAQEAIDHIYKATELNPHYTFDYPWNLGMAHYTLKRYDDAVRFLKEALARNESLLNPNLFLIASYVQLGRLEDAQWEATRLMVTYPQFTLSHLADSAHVYKDKKAVHEFIGVLRKAGLPE